MQRKKYITAQFVVHDAVGSRFLMIIQVGKICMKTVSYLFLNRYFKN